MTSSDGAKSYGLGLAAGAEAGAFASGGIARAKYSDVDGSGTAYSLTGGYAFDLNRTRTVQFCPYLDLDHEAGPDIDLGFSTLKTSVDAVGIGGSVGETMRVTPKLDLVPFVGATYAIARLWVTLDGETDSQSRRYGMIDVGAGLVINKVLTLQPQVSIPVGVDGAKSAFALSIGYSFGSSKP